MRSVRLTASMSPKRYATRSSRAPDTKDAATNPMARAEWAITPRSVSIAYVFPLNMDTRLAINKEVISAPRNTDVENANASAIPRTDACAVASPK